MGPRSASYNTQHTVEGGDERPTASLLPPRTGHVHCRLMAERSPPGEINCSGELR